MINGPYLMSIVKYHYHVAVFMFCPKASYMDSKRIVDSVFHAGILDGST